MNIPIKNLTKRLKNEIFGGMKEKICYVHTHKCGGTSIGRAIREHYIGLDMRRDQELVSIDAEASAIASGCKNKSVDEIYEFREKILIYFLELRNTRFITGHFLFKKKIFDKFNDRFAFIIVFRNPVERWISHYFFNRYKEKEYGKINQDINECLTSDFGKLNGREYIQFLGGSIENDFCIKEAIELSKNNLKLFELVGFLEHKDEFVKKFEHRFGVKLRLQKRNMNPKSEAFKKSFLTKEIKDKITDLCKPDIELYNYAIKNYLKIP